MSSESSPVLQIDHVEAYDGGYAYILHFFGTDKICLGKGAGKMRCKTIDPEDFSEIVAMAGRLPRGLNSVHHGEFAQIHLAEKTEIYSIDTEAEDVKIFLGTVDRLFLSKFPQAYDWSFQ